MTSKYTIYTVLFLSLLTGCKDQTTDTRQINPESVSAGNNIETDEHSVINVESDDEEMNQAIEKAKATFYQFLENWQGEEVEYSLKFAMATSTDGVEHIWFNPLQIQDGTIVAVCANEPVNIPDLNYGDERVLGLSELSDWMIVKDGKCYGAYTLRVLTKLDPTLSERFEFADFDEIKEKEI